MYTGQLEILQFILYAITEICMLWRYFNRHPHDKKPPHIISLMNCKLTCYDCCISQYVHVYIVIQGPCGFYNEITLHDSLLNKKAGWSQYLVICRSTNLNHLKVVTEMLRLHKILPMYIQVPVHILVVQIYIYMCTSIEFDSDVHVWCILDLVHQG